MRAYWQSLQSRERSIFLAAGVFLVLLLVYLLVIEPWQSERQRLQQSIAAQQQTLQWMQQAAAEVQVLRRSQSGTQQDGTQSLMGVVDASARRTGVAGAIRQIRPDGQGVTVRLEAVGFDDMLRWIGQLHRDHAIQVSNFTMERLPQPGRVNASVILTGVM